MERTSLVPGTTWRISRSFLPWVQNGMQFKKGDMVLLAEDNQRPIQPIQVFVGNVDLVHFVEVKTASGELTRPIVQLRKLGLDIPDDLDQPVSVAQQWHRRLFFPSKVCFQLSTEVNSRSMDKSYPTWNFLNAKSRYSDVHQNDWEEFRCMTKVRAVNRCQHLGAFDNVTTEGRHPGRSDYPSKNPFLEDDHQ